MIAVEELIFPTTKLHNVEAVGMIQQHFFH